MFQAALAPIALSHVSDPNSKEHTYAKQIITVCILSIMITTTIGAALVTLLGSKLLRKTKFAVEPEQWRRSHRPSVRDISIIEEDEELDDDSEANTENQTAKVNTDTASSEPSMKSKSEHKDDGDMSDETKVEKSSSTEKSENLTKNSNEKATAEDLLKSADVTMSENDHNETAIDDNNRNKNGSEQTQPNQLDR